MKFLRSNKPFPSSLVSLSQNESLWETFIKNEFDMYENDHVGGHGGTLFHFGMLLLEDSF